MPEKAWEYRLGSRSALEWLLDQYKERKPRDPTIREKFNNYRFSDHKERVIDLLRRVCTVSVATMEIVDSMAHRELGEPRINPRLGRWRGVYPRVGGGTATPADKRYSFAGLSPRGRGNPVLSYMALAFTRSIPAWAGEPGYGGSSSDHSTVYPRVGGGTLATTA